MPSMKALSIRQPWANLIVQGKKNIEIRRWKTNFRGRFLIHASKRVCEAGKQLYYSWSAEPRGYVIGAATLVRVKPYTTRRAFMADHYDHLNLPEWWENPRYGFMLEDIRPVKPFPVKGQLNFFEVEIGRLRL